jgi:hypothetical protein
MFALQHEASQGSGKGVLNLSNFIILKYVENGNHPGCAAEEYAQQFAWAVLPLHTVRFGGCTCRKIDCTSPGKHPLTRNGVKDAKKDIRAIAAWWERWSWANVGIATGAVSGFFVVDVDGETGEESLEELERENGKLPGTVEALTGGGGRHIFFRCPDYAIGNRVALAPGLDVRGDGGYIVAAPSVHVSGWQYMWELSSRPGEVDIADAPGWLLAMLRPAETAGQRKPSSDWHRLSTTPAPEGERNDRIARIAGHLLRLYVDPYLASALVHSWNQQKCEPPLFPDEVDHILNSIADRELRRRRCGNG